jgi:protease PrsW
MAMCNRCGGPIENNVRFCARCGADQAPGEVHAAAAPASIPAQPAQHYAPTPPQYSSQYPQYPPPGMIPVIYQAYPGGPQQVYYVPAQGVYAHARGGFFEGIQAQIRSIASSDKLEGFSLRKTFSETFKRRGEGAIEEYAMVGSSRTTPPIELVDTNWPKPWMFFRLLAAFAITAIVLYLVWFFTGQPGVMPAIMIFGTFAMPVAVLVFIFEMNTPRNVSVLVVAELLVIGGVAGLGMSLLEYAIPPISNLPGVVEETAKLLVTVFLMRSVRYKYELNGILFGAAVGAGFACFETCAYALGVLGQSPGGPPSGFLAAAGEIARAQFAIQHATTQAALQKAGESMHQALSDALTAMAVQLGMRGLLSPFGHPVYTAISAGAFWRVKRDRPFSVSMLFDMRFLMAFAIPVLEHTLWDIQVLFPNFPGLMVIPVWIFVAVTSWYVLFTMIQQGLHQVRNVQRAQLEATLSQVQTTMQPMAGTYAMQPGGPAGA